MIDNKLYVIKKEKDQTFLQRCWRLQHIIEYKQRMKKIKKRQQYEEWLRNPTRRGKPITLPPISLLCKWRNGFFMCFVVSLLVFSAVSMYLLYYPQQTTAPKYLIPGIIVQKDPVKEFYEWIYLFTVLLFPSFFAMCFMADYSLYRRSLVFDVEDLWFFDKDDKRRRGDNKCKYNKECICR